MPIDPTATGRSAANSTAMSLLSEHPRFDLEGWNGLSGMLELRLLSGSNLGTKDTEESVARKSLAKFSSAIVAPKPKFRGRVDIFAAVVGACRTAAPAKAPRVPTNTDNATHGGPHLGRPLALHSGVLYRRCPTSGRT
eukprot:UN10225